MPTNTLNWPPMRQYAFNPPMRRYRHLNTPIIGKRSLKTIMLIKSLGVMALIYMDLIIISSIPETMIPTSWGSLYASTKILLGSGSNQVSGNIGSDKVHTGAGDDIIRGGAGDDIICGCAGDDQLIGGDGDDIIYGDWGNDILYGGAGDDILVGGAGRDIMVGGKGDDTFYIGDLASSVRWLMSLRIMVKGTICFPLSPAPIRSMSKTPAKMRFCRMARGTMPRFTLFCAAIPTRSPVMMDADGITFIEIV